MDSKSGTDLRASTPGPTSSSGTMGPNTHLALASHRGPASLFASTLVAQVSVGATKLPGSAGGSDPLSPLLVPWVPCSRQTRPVRSLEPSVGCPIESAANFPTLTDKHTDVPSWLDAHIRRPTHVRVLHEGTCQCGDRQRRAEGGQAASLGAGTNKGGTGHCHLSQIRWNMP